MADALKPLPTNLIGEFLKSMIPIIAKENKLEHLITKNDSGLNVCTLYLNNNSGEDILKVVNTKMISDFDDYIETETGELASHFNRSLIFFESEISNNTLFIRWI